MRKKYIVPVCEILDCQVKGVFLTGSAQPQPEPEPQGNVIESGGELPENTFFD